MKEGLIIENDPELLQQELERMRNEKNVMENQMALMVKEMNHFTYIVSHDLQAPLRMVTGFLELLEKKYGDQLDDTAKNYISYAVKGSVKMKNLIFDLLVYSRLNTVRQELVEVDLNDVFGEVKQQFKKEIEDTAATVKVDNLPVVLADKKQMVQLLFHLFSNALKFRKTSVPDITITSVKEKGMWRIGISDNGIGIEESFYEKIFVVFRRLYADEVKYRGTGIGLAICKKVVELHKGEIWVESELKKGSTFYFKVPAIA